MNVTDKIKEYLRLGRLFNAEILALIFILSYLLAATLYHVKIEIQTLIGLFIVGVLAHIWGGYNNDRLDLSVDKKARYCDHKPLVSGRVSIKTATAIEVAVLVIFIILILLISPRVFTLLYTFCAVSLAYLYNRYNKSNMFINIVGQMYASFVVLVGMSIVVDFDFILILSALVMGLNGVYLNIIEADLKDFAGDVVNVPKALGVRFDGESAENKTNFYLLNEGIKLCLFLLVLFILYLEEADVSLMILAGVFFGFNFLVRQLMFKVLSSNREKMKPYIAAQELTSILLISTIYIVVYPLIPIFVVVFVFLWLAVWNKFLWGTFLRPQV